MEAWLLAFAITLHVWLAASVSDRLSLAGDENAHLAGGYGYWLHHDYRVHSENGVLAQRWTALPLLVLRPAMCSPDSSDWREARYRRVAQTLLFRTENDLNAMLRWARLMNALLGGAVAAVVFFWARSLFSPSAGWLALGLAAFCPNLLAHSGLANSDITITLAYLLALSAWWRMAHAATPGRVALAGVTLGILATAKFSGVLFALIGPPLLFLRHLHPAPLRVSLGHVRLRLEGPRKAMSLTCSGLCAGLIALAIVWASYGFRYSAAPDGSRPAIWNYIIAEHAREGGLYSTGLNLARTHRLLPEAWLQGFAHVKWAAGQRRGFLAGEYSTEGWREFFPTAFAIKTPIGALLLLFLATLLACRRGGGRRGVFSYRASPLLVFILVYGGFAIASSINIGLRHILPLYPAFFILAGSVVLHATPCTRRPLAAVIVSLLVAHIAASFAVRPHYLAFFNSLVGGPEQGHRYLVDSSLDWGQGLPDLSRWLARNARPGEQVHLSYFGNDRPSRHGIHAVRTGDSKASSGAEREALPVMREGLYCVSATQLRQIYVWYFGLWSEAHENRYRDLLRVYGDPLAPSPPDGVSVPVTGEFDDLRFGRLCHFLRVREPDAMVAHSILIFRLTEAELLHYLIGDLESAGAAQ